MTSEVIVMNKNGIAMAADSAVYRYPEYGQNHRQRKIYSLGPQHTLGLMIHQRLRLNGIPWETIFKLFQSSHKEPHFQKTDDCAQELANFIITHKHFFDHEQKNLSWIYDALEYVRILGGRLQEQWHVRDSGAGKAVDHSFIRHVSDCLDQKLHALESLPTIFPIESDKLEALVVHEFNKFGWDYLARAFDIFPFTETVRHKIVKILSLATAKDDFELGYSGIVFGGFGADDIFPSASYIKIGGFYFGHLKYRILPCNKISNTNQAQIIPYAETDSISAFLQGIHPDVQNLCLGEFKHSLHRLIMEGNALFPAQQQSQAMENLIEQHYRAYKQKLTRLILADYIQPLIDGIKFLPQEGLSHVAESLIKLACFKNAMMPGPQSVGGDVDVAVISKGDGFTWTKKRDYLSGPAEGKRLEA